MCYDGVGPKEDRYEEYLNAYAVALEVTFLVISVLQRLVVKPCVEKFVLMILL